MNHRFTRAFFFLFLLVMYVAAGSSFAQNRNDSMRLSPWKSYEMFSWQQSTGAWNFCLLPSPSGVYIQAQQVFNDECQVDGVIKIKRKIAKLQRGAIIYWHNYLRPEDSKKDDIRRLSYPPASVVTEIHTYAEKRGIHVQTNNQDARLAIECDRSPYHMQSQPEIGYGIACYRWLSNPRLRIDFRKSRGTRTLFGG